MKKFKVVFLLDGGHKVELYLIYNSKTCTSKMVKDNIKKLINRANKGVDTEIITGVKTLKHGDANEIYVVPNKICSFTVEEIKEVD